MNNSINYEKNMQTRAEVSGSPSRKQIVSNKSSELRQSELVWTRNSMPKTLYFYLMEKLFLHEKL